MADPTEKPERLIDTAAAARRLHVSRRTVVRLVQAGYLPATRSGERGWQRISPEALSDLVRSAQCPTRETGQAAVGSE